MTTATASDNFSQAELDKFNALANRWWGESARLRATGSRAGERPCMDARAGTAHHGWFSAMVIR
jgi:2-polyprenyl-3-methyl-5-hydroxy-6-metoxy-1,4-benzoquinol methylase